MLKWMMMTVFLTLSLGAYGAENVCESELANPLRYLSQAVGIEHPARLAFDEPSSTPQQRFFVKVAGSGVGLLSGVRDLPLAQGLKSMTAVIMKSKAHPKETNLLLQIVFRNGLHKSFVLDPLPEGDATYEAFSLTLDLDGGRKVKIVAEHRASSTGALSGFHPEEMLIYFTEPRI